jgi:hypothetical protein
MAHEYQRIDNGARIVISGAPYDVVKLSGKPSGLCCVRRSDKLKAGSSSEASKQVPVFATERAE